MQMIFVTLGGPSKRTASAFYLTLFQTPSSPHSLSFQKEARLPLLPAISHYDSHFDLVFYYDSKIFFRNGVIHSKNEEGDNKIKKYS